MEDPVLVLRYVAMLGTAFCLASYVYGYIVRSKGDRRWHTASLLFSGLALANFAVVLPAAARGVGLLPSAMALLFLLLGVACQAFTAFRGRSTDRAVARTGVGELEVQQRRIAPLGGDVDAHRPLDAVA